MYAKRICALALAVMILLPVSGFALEEVLAAESSSAGHIDVSVTNKDGEISLKWSGVKGASSYTVTKKVRSAYDPSVKFSEGKKTFITRKTSYRFRELFPGRRYTFRVRAEDRSGNVIAASDALSEQPVITPVTSKKRKSRTVKATKMYFANGRDNLREYMKESHDGYSVVQGGCTDGKYAYYLMVCSENQHGRIAKVRMKDGKLAKVSRVLDVWHGNGMTYDSRRKQLVVTSRDEPWNGVFRKHEITCIDADTLKIIKKRQKDISYSHFDGDEDNFTDVARSRGLASIAYSERYDVYIADQRIDHNLIVIDPDTFEAMGIIRTKIIKKYPAVFQGMDADDQYAYILLSPDGEDQKRNLILALDWNSAKLADSNGHRRQYVAEKWNCLNGKKPAAVYRIKVKREAENIYHTTDTSGRTHFYLSEYYYDENYRTDHIRETYKVLKRKIMKRFRTGRSSFMVKLIREYEKKYRIIRKKVSPRANRLDYVYDLGVL